LSGLGRVLRHRNARLYLAAVTVSGFGSSAMTLATGIWVLSLTESTSLAALVSFLIWAPVLLGPVAGAVVDRASRRRAVLIWTNGVMALLLPVLLVVRSEDQLWVIFAVMLMYGVSSVVNDAAESAVLPAAVPKDLLGDVNGLRMAAGESMKLTAPLAGAGLFAWLGGGSVAVLDAVTFVLALVCCVLLRFREEPVRHEDGSWVRSIAQGWQQIWHHRLLRRLVLAGAATMFLAGINGALVYAVVQDGLRAAPAMVGVLYAFQGAGSVAGGIAGGALMRRLGPRVFAGAGIALFATGVVLRVPDSLPLVLAGSFLVGLGLPWVLIAGYTLVQTDITAAFLGRVSSTAVTVTYTPNAVAIALGAGLVAVADHRVLLVGTGVAGLATALLCLRPVQN
jgi:Na+/melibiose symporter-like transporter